MRDPLPTITIGALVLEGEAALSAAGIEPARLESEVLLAKNLSAGRAALILDPGQVVPGEIAAAYRGDIARRAARYPLQYITGVQEFHSLDFEVDERVLIPRPETEMIVDEVLRLEGSAAGPNRRPVSGSAVAADGAWIVDVGTGSGCLAVTLAVKLPGARVFASDVSEGALAVAGRNAARHGAAERVTFALGDGLAPAIRAGLAGRVDFLVSNPPYIADSELAGLQPELAHEPRGALTPGPDGLSFTARLVADAARVVRPGGRLLVELGAGSAERARRLVDPALWDEIRVLPDPQGIDRVLSARRR